jgi:hypothetical protein
VRSVFDADLSKSDSRADWRPGASVTIALVDLPVDALPCATGYPVPVDLVLVRDGVADGFVIGKLTLTGNQGQPTPFAHLAEEPALAPGESLDERFGPKPALRLRPLAGAGTPAQPGFAFDWVIGSIEFDLTYKHDKVSAPVAFTATNAVNGTAVVGPSTPLDVDDSVAHVVLMDPKGFTLPELHPWAVSGGAGEGPVLEIAFDKLTQFGTGDFAIENLVVTKLDGTIQVDLRGETGSGAYFQTIAVASE